MKKILLLAATAFGLIISASAQYGRNNGDDRYRSGNSQSGSRYENQRGNHDDEDDDAYGGNRNGKCKKNHGKKRNDYDNGNAPAQVRNSFYRDYPNASNVRWEKDRGVWTAYFNSGMYGGMQSASYFANGDRIGSNNNGGYGNGNNYNYAPAQVQSAFERDYPNASNVSWAKNNRVWTATFRSGLLGGTRTASYYENGDRADNNGTINNQGIPYRVQQAFERDYPNVANVNWTINKGYYTATFRTGILGAIRTATYDANGNRV